MQRLDSAANEKIKLAVKIATSSKQRKLSGMFFLEGLRLCRDAALTGIEIAYAFFSERLDERFVEDVDFICKSAEEYFEISLKVEDKLSQTKSSQGVFCLCRMPERKCIVEPDGKYIALENIQDPANLGAVSRTAEALGIDGIIVCGGCDIYGPKSQRASMGSLLRLPVIECEDLKETLLSCKNSGMRLYATSPDSAAKSILKADMNGGVVAVIGNEANGISDEIFAICERITIPMLGRAESLNASMAAALTMWEMLREKGAENE